MKKPLVPTLFWLLLLLHCCLCVTTLQLPLWWYFCLTPFSSLYSFIVIIVRYWNCSVILLMLLKCGTWHWYLLHFCSMVNYGSEHFLFCIPLIWWRVWWYSIHSIYWWYYWWLLWPSDSILRWCYSMTLIFGILSWSDCYWYGDTVPVSLIQWYSVIQ